MRFILNEYYLFFDQFSSRLAWNFGCWLTFVTILVIISVAVRPGPQVRRITNLKRSMMMQKIRNRLPKLFRKNEKEKIHKQSDFDLANTFILLLSQKMQQLSLSKKIVEQKKHAYFFKNRRRNQRPIDKEANFRVSDRSLAGGKIMDKDKSQGAHRLSLPPLPHTVNYSWLFNNEDTYKLNCFERAKIREQCRQLTLDQSVLAYEIFLKRSEKITEPTDLPKVLDEIMVVLLSRKPVRKNCMEAFRKRMEMKADAKNPSSDKFSLKMLPPEARSFRMDDASKFSPFRKSPVHLTKEAGSPLPLQKDLSQEESDEQRQSLTNQILNAIDNIRVVYVQSKENDDNDENRIPNTRRIRLEKKEPMNNRRGERNSLIESSTDNENISEKQTQEWARMTLRSKAKTNEPITVTDKKNNTAIA